MRYKDGTRLGERKGGEVVQLVVVALGRAEGGELRRREVSRVALVGDARLEKAFRLLEDSPAEDAGGRHVEKPPRLAVESGLPPARQLPLSAGGEERVGEEGVGADDGVERGAMLVDLLPEVGRREVAPSVLAESGDEARQPLLRIAGTGRRHEDDVAGEGLAVGREALRELEQDGRLEGLGRAGGEVGKDGGGAVFDGDDDSRAIGGVPSPAAQDADDVPRAAVGPGRTDVQVDLLADVVEHLRAARHAHDVHRDPVDRSLAQRGAGPRRLLQAVGMRDDNGREAEVGVVDGVEAEIRVDGTRRVDDGDLAREVASSPDRLLGGEDEFAVEALRAGRDGLHVVGAEGEDVEAEGLVRHPAGTVAKERIRDVDLLAQDFKPGLLEGALD